MGTTGCPNKYTTLHKRCSILKLDILTKYAGFLPGIFSGGQNLLLCKFLLFYYCFRTKFQGGAKSPRGELPQGGSPAPLWKKAIMFSLIEESLT